MHLFAENHYRMLEVEIPPMILPSALLPQVRSWGDPVEDRQGVQQVPLPLHTSDTEGAAGRPSAPYEAPESH